MYLEYVLNQPSVIQEMETQKDLISEELNAFDSFIENVVFENLPALVGENLPTTFENVREFACSQAIEYLQNTAARLSY